jgi:Domain of unknown function (DUF6457)
VTDDPGQVFAALTASMGAPPLGEQEITAVLRLAKAVADASERRFAPLTCYAAGLVIGASARDEVRLAKLQDFIDRVVTARC